MPVAIYYNADFDLSLRPRPHSLRTARVQKRVRALTLNGILGGTSEDRVLLRATAPETYLAYLRAHGLQIPQVDEHPGHVKEASLLPLGWNEDARNIDDQRAAPAIKPTEACVRRVNSRIFSLSLEQELLGEQGKSKACRSLMEVEQHVRRTEGLWMAKSNHGNAGLANRRLSGPTLDSVDRRLLQALFREDDWLVLEPWRERCLDLCTVFRVSRNGTAQDTKTHEAIHTAEGGFIGAAFHGKPESALRWRETLEETASYIARKLCREGYSGPVALDSFVWQDGGQKRLRPIVDLNCRQPASFAASRFLSRLRGHPCLLWRFLSRRRMRLPLRYRDWTEALMDRDFNPSRERGVLLASPLIVEMDQEPTPSAKIGIAIVGDSRDDLAEQETWLRRHFQP